MHILRGEFKKMSEFIINVMRDYCLGKLLKKDKKSTI